MTMPEHDELATLLASEREEPDPRFAEELDRWAAAGFPRAQRPGAPQARPGAALAPLPPPGSDPGNGGRDLHRARS